MKPDASDMQKKADLKKELLSSKINFGKDKTDYGTTYNTEHDDKGYCRDYGKSQEIMKDLRSTHYKLGYLQRPLNTHYQTDFIETNGKPSNLDPTLAKDLRSHHTTLGIDRAEWETTYRGQHFWKQPEREDN